MSELIRLASELGFLDGIAGHQPQPVMDNPLTPEAIRESYNLSFLHGAFIAAKMEKELAVC